MPTTTPSTTPLDDLRAFLEASPSPFHAVESARTRLETAGFTELTESDPWSRNDVWAKRFCIRGGALIAWNGTSAQPSDEGFRIIGAHTDSPNLRVKPQPDVTSVGYREVGVEIYGGVLANSWLDRDLGVSGRLLLKDREQLLVKIDRPIARVAQLAVHLDRDVNEKGVVLDRQLHLLPISGLVPEIESSQRKFLDFVASSIGVAVDDVSSFDLMFHDLTPPALLGIDSEFLVSARIDNQFSCWAGVAAMAQAPASGAVTVVALFDHEEVGSASTTGAAGPLLERVIGRVSAAFGLDTDALGRALSVSSCVSADMAHAVHPNYADRHEPNHRPVPNGGPVIKVNVNQRYATDATSAGMFAHACRAADVPMQTFVSRNSQPCGSTIGPITATRLGIDTVDVGCAMLSMHSARELCGAGDAELMVRALTAYLAS